MARDRRLRHSHKGSSALVREKGFSPRFFLSADPPAVRPKVPGTRSSLTLEDSHHALKVLRLRPGDRCEVVAEDGVVYEGVVSDMGPPMQVTLAMPLQDDRVGAVYQHEVGVVQAIPRPSAADFVVEKGTEVGADFFLLVQSEGSSRHADGGTAERLERWRRIAREAAKQSKQTRVPLVETCACIDEALVRLNQDRVHNVVLDPGALLALAQVLEDLPRSPKMRIALWVGPEGGWSAAESQALRVAGASSAGLGRSILRTETAGPVAVAIARLALDDW